MGLFGRRLSKMHGWESLTKSEQDFLALCDRSMSLEYYISRANSNESATSLVRFVLNNYPPSDPDEYQGALLEAVNFDNPEVISEIFQFLGKQGTDFFIGWGTSFGLESAIANAQSMPCWEAVCEGMRLLPLSRRVSLSDFAAYFAEKDFVEGLHDILYVKTTENHIYVWRKAMLAAAACCAPATLKTMVDALPRFHGADVELNAQLYQAVSNKSCSAAEALLKAGADANVNEGEVFRLAARSNHLKMMKLLVAHGALVKDYAPSILSQRPASSMPAEVYEFLDSFCDGRFAEERRLKAELQVDDRRFKLMDSDTLSEMKTLSNGGVLTIMFNFATRQQIIVAERHGISMTVTPFSELDDKGVLDLAMRRFVALKGDKKLVEGLDKIPLKKARLPINPPDKG